MIIRKSFKFESAHRVRSSTCSRCKNTVHGHSYICEVFLENKEYKDMVMDFGDLKIYVGNFMDSLDHSLMLWEGDDQGYIVAQQNYSKRIVWMVKDPTAENIACAILKHVSIILAPILNVSVTAVRIHETSTGYAEASSYTDEDVITIGHSNED